MSWPRHDAGLRCDPEGDRRGYRGGAIVLWFRPSNLGGNFMDQKIINLYDNFTHSRINRREFMEELIKLAGSTAAAVALLPLLQNDYAKAQIVQANDPRLNAEKVSFDSPKGKVSGYLVRAKGTTKRPAVIVIHENRGLNPHLEDVARLRATCSRSPAARRRTTMRHATCTPRPTART